jgi:hypothetical protein
MIEEEKTESALYLEKMLSELAISDAKLAAT